MPLDNGADELSSIFKNFREKTMAYTLKIGSTGPLVKRLQEKLRDSGALPANDQNGVSNIDGKFFRITHDAVIKFQEDHGLAVDGIFGKETADALDLALPVPAVMPNPSHVFTPDQLRKLAEVIDSFIPTGPFDFFDDSVIAWLVNKLDNSLAEILPPKILLLLNDLSNGLDGHDLEAFKTRLVKGINQRINVPILSEETEGKIISFFVNLVVDALQTGRSFSDSLATLKANQLARI